MMPTIPTSMAPLIDQYMRETGQMTDSPAQAPEPAKSKYRASKTEIDGRIFDSKKEANRYLDLREEQKAGRISELRCQVSFDLVVNGELVCRYISDFVYIRDGVEVVEDCKGFRTKDYIIKRKLFKAVFGKAIKET